MSWIGAARAGLLDPHADLVAAALAVEALACESAAAGMALALHTAALLALAEDDRFTSLVRGETVSALSLSTEDVPSLDASKLTGRAAWVGPITERGIAIVGARQGDEITACAVSLDAKGVQVVPVTTSALRGFVSAYLTFAGRPCIPAGAPTRIMARRGRSSQRRPSASGTARCVNHLAVAHRERGAGGEQTARGTARGYRNRARRGALAHVESGGCDQGCLVGGSVDGQTRRGGRGAGCRGTCHAGRGSRQLSSRPRDSSGSPRTCARSSCSRVGLRRSGKRLLTRNFHTSRASTRDRVTEESPTPNANATSKEIVARQCSLGVGSWKCDLCLRCSLTWVIFLPEELLRDRLQLQIATFPRRSGRSSRRGRISRPGSP
jgi:hypothetical protein